MTPQTALAKQHSTSRALFKFIISQFVPGKKLVEAGEQPSSSHTLTLPVILRSLSLGVVCVSQVILVTGIVKLVIARHC